MNYKLFLKQLAWSVCVCVCGCVLAQKRREEVSSGFLVLAVSLTAVDFG